METSASFDARSAPSSYPTGGGRPPPVTRWARGNSRPYRDRTGARTRGVERHTSLAWRCSTEQVVSDLERRTHAAAESTKDGRKPDHATGMLGASLTEG
jgi:hypothetical protein